MNGEITSIFTHFHLCRLMAMLELAQACQGCNSEIVKFGINLKFDGSMGEHSDGKNWMGCFHLFQCVFFTLSAARMEFMCSEARRKGRGNQCPQEESIPGHWGNLLRRAVY